MRDAMQAMLDAAEKIKAHDDNLLLAIAHIAAAGQIQVMPSPHLFGAAPKPVILLPERMYNRMLEIIPTGSTEPDAGGEIRRKA